MTLVPTIHTLTSNLSLLNATSTETNRSLLLTTSTTPYPANQVTQVTEISPTVTYIIFIINGLLALLGIIGNIFVCMIIIRGRKMYTIANLFLMNLAIADMFVLVVSYPLWVLQTLFHDEWPFGSALCKIIPSISDAFYGVSLGCITSISIHRYRMILHAMDKQLTFFQAKIILVFIWVVSLGTISAPLYPVLQYYETPTGGKGCYSKWPDKTYERTYQLFLCIFWYIFPLFVILLSFLRIKWYLEKQMTYEWLRGSEHTVLVKNHIIGIRTALRMLAPVVVFFALLMLPWNIIRLISVVREITTIPHFRIYIMVSGTMLVANSVINPFIYYMMSKEFRLEFKKQLWLLKVNLRIVKDKDSKYTIESDSKGRKFVRRFESFLEYSEAPAKLYTMPRDRSCTGVTQTTENVSNYQYSTGVIVNDYEIYNDLFRNHNGVNGNYEELKLMSSNNNRFSSALYSITEENRHELDSPEKQRSNYISDDKLIEAQIPCLDKEDVKETIL